jgi:ribose transport system ATP-binding protein
MRDMGRLELVATMLGKELSALHGARRAAPDAALPEVLHVGHLKSGRVQDASLVVRRGQIVGLGGLLGSGRTELARAVFGAERAEAGEIRINGEQARLEQPADAIARGVAYLSEDRKTEGIVADLSIRENLTLVLLPQLTRLGLVDAKRQLEITEEFILRLGIRCAGPEQPVRELSGGNQQKVLLARWLASRIQLLLLDEATRGIDVGAKAEILQLIRGLADEQGLAVLMIASELEELVGASDRVTVLRDGRSVAELEGSELTESAVMAAMAHASPGEATHG